MKKCIAILLCAVIALAVTACGQTESAPALTKEKVLEGFDRIYGIALTYLEDSDAEGDKSVELTVNEDKTAVLNGEEAKWKVKTNDGGYLEIDSVGKDVYHLSVLAYEDEKLDVAGSYALTNTETEKLYVKNMAIAEVETVEINEDNWEDYLEVVPVLYKQTDVFGEIEDIHYSHAVRLNEKYKDAKVVPNANVWADSDYKAGDIASADIAVELKLSGLTVKTIVYDIKKGSYELKDYKLEEGDTLVSDKSVVAQATLDGFDIVHDSDSVSIEGGWNDYYDLTLKNDGKTISRTEELYEKAKVNRIKGTISFLKDVKPKETESTEE